MPLCKICPSCGTKNEVDAIICSRCFNPLTYVTPNDDNNNGSDEDIKIEVVNDETIVANASIEELFLEGQNISIKIKSDDVIGRHCKNSSELSKYQTISRKHAQFIYVNNKWFVKDLGSTNGTYLNDMPLEKGKEYEIRDGETIKLSRTVSFTVVIKQVSY
jgi:pSer/pThr/pTyr-binding forkhead associated (FHA) protein